VRVLIGLSELNETPVQGRINPAIILGVPAVENLYPVSFVYILNARLCRNNCCARHNLRTVSNLLMRGN